MTILIGLLSSGYPLKQLEKETVFRKDSSIYECSTTASIEYLQYEIQGISDTLVSVKDANTLNEEIDVSKDSVKWFEETDFIDLDSALVEISHSEFKKCKETYQRNCELDQSGFVTGKGLVLHHFCEEICETYFMDEKEGIKLVLPSDFDMGIMGLIISPSCNQFIVYSSYPGTDFNKFYDHRAEVFGFAINQGQGIQIIQPTFKLYSEDWSIEEVIWNNDNEIAIKTYEESRSLANQDNLTLKYLKTKIK